MRKSAFIIGAASLVLVVALSFRATAAGNAKQEITELEHQLIAATTADEAMKVYDDNDASLFNLSGPPLAYRGSRAVHDSFADFFNNVTDFKGDFVALTIVTDGKMGMAESIQHFTWKGKDGKPAEVTDRVTDVLKKEKTGWKIIHTHISVPIDPKTGQGEMNLKS
jgi:ketosteroid isomerase-like protein